jgi:hypothetical protein
MIGVNPKELYEFFVSKNLKYFFQANTVRTSCTFIEQKGLMSREFVEYKGLTQTPQSSDEIDKKFDVWNDIFLDLFDLHGYFPRQNLYGLVCFIVDNRFLIDNEFNNIVITKTNPIYWDKSMNDDDKYYSTVKEYADEFEENIRRKCIQQKMVTIHNTHKKIPLEKYLVKILLDNPLVKIDDVILYNEAKQKLNISLEKSGFDKNILESRKCANCYCHENYLNQTGIDELKKLFL